MPLPAGKVDPYRFSMRQPDGLIVKGLIRPVGESWSCMWHLTDEGETLLRRIDPEWARERDESARQAREWGSMRRRARVHGGGLMRFPFAAEGGAGAPWCVARDGDPAAGALHRRHYSARRGVRPRNRSLFIGPGEKLVLVTADDRAVFAWVLRRRSFDAAAAGLYCSLFRNEGPRRSSDLIRAAVQLARLRWPDERVGFTYINPRRVRSSNPGFCFLMAGWKRTRRTRGGLHVLEVAL